MKIPVVMLLATWASVGLATDGGTHEELAAIYLAGKDHGPIEKLERPGSGSSHFPGVETFDLVEAPRREGAGCVRQRWHVSAPDGRRAGPQSVDVHASYEVALSQGACPVVGYVGINPGMSSLQAIAVLERLRQPTVLSTRVRLTCSQEFGDQQCNRDHSLAEILGDLRPWLVGRQGQVLYVWLGTPGQLVTEIRYNAQAPHSLQVSRRIPAPF
ncbi:hypothetical protein [Stenotrophomonas sp. Iso1]|uniref:hypothetical protein n=1 Tax=Stenotrophomonas sp. Iso1 TaxID=2977283 RepID=UPI0022B7B0B6|nr:hypothetical protein [Stenotrophomonas sp. Iso1]